MPVTAFVVAIILGVALLAMTSAPLLRLRAKRVRDAASQDRLAARLRAIERESDQAFVLIDQRGVIQSVNPAAERRFGYSEAELLGQSLLRLLPDVRPSERPSGDAEIIQKDGSRVRSSYRCIAAGDGQFYLILGGLPAATEARPVPTTQSPDLEVAERVVSRIVRQLEGPLTAIGGYAQLALDATSQDNPARKDLEEIAVASEMAAQLARHLLNFTGNQVIPVEPMELNALLAELQPQLPGLQIECCAPRLLISANRQSLRQIIYLFWCSASHRQGRETSMQIVTTRRQIDAAPYACVSISDCGPALPARTLACLFEPLFLDEERLGVELSAIYGIVRNLGGMISVASEEARGTTFELLIPLAQDDLGKAEVKPGNSLGAGTSVPH